MRFLMDFYQLTASLAGGPVSLSPQSTIAEQCSSSKAGIELITFNVTRQSYQAVRRTQGTTWRLAG